MAVSRSRALYGKEQSEIDVLVIEAEKTVDQIILSHVAKGWIGGDIVIANAELGLARCNERSTASNLAKTVRTRLIEIYERVGWKIYVNLDDRLTFQ